MSCTMPRELSCSLVHYSANGHTSVWRSPESSSSSSSFAQCFFFFFAFLISHLFLFLNSYYFPLQSWVFLSLIWTFIISVFFFFFSLIWMYIHSCHVHILLYIISSVCCEVVPICPTLWGKRMFSLVTCSCTQKKACCELRKRQTCVIGHRLCYSSWILLAAFLCPPFATSVSACKHTVSQS